LFFLNVKLLGRGGWSEYALRYLLSYPEDRKIFRLFYRLNLVVFGHHGGGKTLCGGTEEYVTKGYRIAGFEAGGLAINGAALVKNLREVRSEFTVTAQA
jgi:hypothetical protein